MAEQEIYQVDINGSVYGLEDTTARKDNVYSTQETDTGKKWIDGKTIYRKAGIYNNGGNVGSGEKLLDPILTTSYVDTIIATGGSAEGFSRILNISGYNSDDNYRLCIAISNNGLVKLASNNNYTKFKWWIEYTKATN